MANRVSPRRTDWLREHQGLLLVGVIVVRRGQVLRAELDTVV